MITKSLQGKIKIARQAWKKTDDQRDAGLTKQVSGIKRFDNLAYGPAGQWNLTDIYRSDSEKTLPVIVNIHGGGWFYGTKETYQFYCLTLAQSGFAVVNFNYRLAPETPYPGAIQDVVRLMNWLANNGATYHLDLNNVYLVGDSAGGQLTEQYLAIDSNPAYSQLSGFNRPRLKIRAAALNCGVYFLPESCYQPDDLETAYFQPALVAKYQPQLEVEKYLTPALPPIFLMTANQDFLREKAVKLDQWLNKSQIAHCFKIYGDAQQPRSHDFQINQKDRIAAQCNQAEIAFFKTYLAD
ncbi:alpha/beta hydrolase [Liquorilactobacillus sicerae]|uniref:alpha/beta hydrolase n=1 Tax=Liquorilactobacillus sicerae TaxID=1416943 RepID=UPI0024804B53|nr:alpha/beta hydrolase [Liquorilactobacillus sicerae]